jgi:hypothetical protein
MSGRVIAGVVLLLLVLLPALSVAVDDLSASPGARHETVRQQPSRGWRTLPSAIERPAHVPRATLLQTIEVPEPAPLLPLLVRTPFVPPRG